MGFPHWDSKETEAGLDGNSKKEEVDHGRSQSDHGRHGCPTSRIGVSERSDRITASTLKRDRDGEFPEIEEALFRWIRQANAMKLAINGNILKEKAILLALKMGQDNFEASNGWLEKFKARRNIAFKRLHGEAGSVDANSVATWKGFVMDEAMEEVVEEEMNRCFEALKKHQAIDVNYIDFLEVDKDVQVAGEQSIEEIVKEEEGSDPSYEILVHIFSPLVTANRLMRSQFSNSYHTVTCRDGMQTVFKEGDYIVVLIVYLNSSFCAAPPLPIPGILQGQDYPACSTALGCVLPTGHLVVWLCPLSLLPRGSCDVEMICSRLQQDHSSNDPRSELLGKLLDQWDVLRSQEQGFLVEHLLFSLPFFNNTDRQNLRKLYLIAYIYRDSENNSERYICYKATERLVVNQDLTSDCVKLLESALKQVRQRSSSQERVHTALFFLRHRLVAHFSSRHSCQFSNSSLLLLSLLTSLWRDSEVPAHRASWIDITTDKESSEEALNNHDSLLSTGEDITFKEEEVMVPFSCSLHLQHQVVYLQGPTRQSLLPHSIYSFTLGSRDLTAVFLSEKAVIMRFHCRSKQPMSTHRRVLCPQLHSLTAFTDCLHSLCSLLHQFLELSAPSADLRNRLNLQFQRLNKVHLTLKQDVTEVCVQLASEEQRKVKTLLNRWHNLSYQSFLNSQALSTIPFSPQVEGSLQTLYSSAQELFASTAMEHLLSASVPHGGLELAWERLTSGLRPYKDFLMAKSCQNLSRALPPLGGAKPTDLVTSYELYLFLRPEVDEPSVRQLIPAFISHLWEVSGITLNNLPHL
ncbi:TIGD6 [Cordylochernes scorpioides]|uniref:TIGD6 n=1 Tax=Cordylochernes scorpioides TaxID=51811 RepID=A0ABY6K1K5_9ARAC|nr:TIGD6 [Cordylochernes scorpioides]